LQHSNDDCVPLADELVMLDHALFLLQQRFGDALAVTREIPEPALAAMVPPLTLHTLMENALKHNIATVEKPLRLHIEASLDTLCVRNNCQPRPKPPTSHGIGLDNLSARYRQLTDQPVRTIAEDGWFAVCCPLLCVEAA